MLLSKSVLTCLILLLLFSPCFTISIFDTEIDKKDVKIFNSNTLQLSFDLLVILLVLLLVLFLIFLHTKQQKIIIGIIYKINCLAASLNNFQTKEDRKKVTFNV